MKRITTLLAGWLLFSITLFSQIHIVQENFGSSTWDGNPVDYPDYTSDALFGGDDSHLFQVANSAGYAEASGGAAVLMGSWSALENMEFVMQYNTEDYTNVTLAFGIKHNSGGWGTCQLTNNFTKIEYSTDSASWTVMDKAALLPGSNWPCADENVWAFVELAQELPSHPKLNIRFTFDNSSPVHPFYLDDITLRGFPPDNNPPTAATNLSSHVMDFKSFILQWNAATDDVGIKFYDVLKNGKFLLSTADTFAIVDYQIPGSAGEYTVIAYDVAENSSPASSPLTVTLDQKPVDYEYSWQKKHANILPTGDIEWQPEAFGFTPGSSIRYIDYETGDDTNDGLSKATPWKHHPWDDNATDNAAAASGVHTYVFKRGVVYRGHLTASESGTPLEPIRLTSDPTWGTGKAWFFGSKRYEGGWTQGDAASAPNIPEPEKVWYIDGWLPETKTVVEMNGDQFTRVHVARAPNYRFTEDDLLRTWYTWTSDSEVAEGRWLRDDTNLSGKDAAYLDGATVWSNEDAIVMCTLWGQDVAEWDAANNQLRVSNTNFGGKGTKYYVENTAFLLDTVNEFYYDQDLQRLYVRLEGDRDPNTTVIEVATTSELIKIESKSYIEISGLAFGVTTAHNVRYGEEDARSGIRLTGINSNISIQNNEFHHMNGGISLNNNGSDLLNTHSMTVSDNDFQHMGDHAIIFSTGSGVYMDDISILRNNIYNNGYRHQGRWYGSIPAIYAQLNYGEIAGNVIDFSMGNGIDLFWGKGGGSNRYVPFIRGFVHQNKASNTLIGVNDYGGIESWQGGPAFIYNNYSHNASGYKHYNNSSIGYTYYFDGAFKHIVFNNIASGVSHNRNSASIMQVLGFYNMYVHNTGYNTSIFLNAWKGTLALDGQNAYLSNAAEDVAYFFRHELESAYIPHEAYAYNVAAGIPFSSSIENRDVLLSLGEFQTTLEGYDARLTQTGWNAASGILNNPANTDFRPLNNTEVINHGVKWFTAFPLARVVGEWSFYKNPSDQTKVLGENFYMTGDFNDRTTYNEVPKNHMSVYNIVDTSFVIGDQEDWMEGALVFDGAVYGEISHADVSSVRSNNVDMTINDFILEVYMKTETDHTGGVILSKYGTAEGYELAIDGSGHAVITLYESGSAAVSRSSNAVVNDGNWHHVLVEVVRQSDISMYVDGQLANGTMTGSLPAEELSLSNSADLLIGKDADDNYFHGAMDFLRISKGSLYDARTTVDELYTWQTDGPFLYDMTGRAPEGQRDAGALESTSSCDMTVSAGSLEFDHTGGTGKVVVTAADGFMVSDASGDFFTWEVDTDSVIVTVTENIGLDERSGSVSIVGCNEIVVIQVNQSGAPCAFTCATDVLELTGEEQAVNVEVLTNGTLQLAADMDFVTVTEMASADSITIHVDENKSGTRRTATVSITHCDGIHTIDVTQETLTGIYSHGLDAGMTVYPNPVTGDHFFIGLPETLNSCEYSITDLSGKVLQNGHLHSSDGAVPLHVSPGSYILKVTGEGVSFNGRLLVL